MRGAPFRAACGVRAASAAALLLTVVVAIGDTAAGAVLAAPADPEAPPAPAAPAALGVPVAHAPASAAPEAHSLDGEWTVWLDPAAVGLLAGEDWPAALQAGARPPSAPPEPVLLAVPGPLEASEATAGYDGVAFYVKDFTVPGAPGALDGARLALRFDQVNWACRAWLDGVEVGAHEGGYDPFELELTGGLLPGSHRLVLRVLDPGGTPIDGVRLKTTPHAKESWYENFGGVLGSVRLEIDRGLRVEVLALRADGARDELHLRAALAAAPAAREALAASAGTAAAGASGSRDPAASGSREPSVPVTVRVDGVARATLAVPLYGGRGDFDLRLDVPGAERWSPESPRLYRVTLESGGQVLAARDVGFRTLELRDGSLLVNGAPRVLKGVLWQPHYTGTGGVTPAAAELEAEVAAMKATGFDLVRAHVRPAPPAFLDACDRLGLFVLEEPAIGWVEDDPGLLPRLLHELDWMVERDAHRPCILFWGVLNELSGKGYRHADALVAHLLGLDDTRPILQDSGGFFGDGRVWWPGSAGAGGTTLALLPMLDRHAYPPFPLPPHDRDELLTLGAPASGSGASPGPDAPRAPQLTFVSEFGYGTLTDCVTALAGFEARGLQGEERVRYQTGAGVERRTARNNRTWTETDWRAAADRNQADAAEELVETLRSNPAVDLLCYTQWRAVSTECSAGVLAPWGEDRPVRERLRHALRPLLCAVLPQRFSVRPDEPVPCTLAVVNDTGMPVTGRLRLRWSLAAPEPAAGATAPDAGTAAPPEASAAATKIPAAATLSPATTGDLDLGERTFPVGVTQVPAEVPARGVAGALTVGGVLQPAAGGAAEVGSTRIVRVVAPPAVADAPRTWLPPDDAEGRALLARLQWPVADALRDADAVLLAHPETLPDALPLPAQLELWEWVRSGGSAVVALRNPGEAALGEILGLSRGIETPSALPLRLAVGSAPGNFMARLFVQREGNLLSVLGRDDEVLSPRAMLVGDLPEGSEQHMLAVGHLGNWIGAPDASVPFGRGRFRLTGLPLLADVEGRPDPRRDATLAGLLHDAAQRTRAAREAPASAAPGAGPQEPPTPDAPATTVSPSTAVAPATAVTPATAAAGIAALTPEQVAALSEALALVRRAVAFGDRTSPWLGALGGPPLPAPLAAALDGKNRALLALLDGRVAEARTELAAAVAQAWSADFAEFLALEQAVLAGLAQRVAAQTLPDWDAAYDVAELWIRAVAHWVAGDRAPALDALGQARQRLAAP